MTNFRFILLIVSIALLMIFSFLAFEHSATRLIQQAIEFNGSFYHTDIWIALLVISVLTVDVLLPVPSSLIAVFAGASLGFATGTLVVFIGLTGGCLFGFCLGRGCNKVLPGHWFPKYQRQDAVNLSMSIDGWALVLMRAVPVLAETSVIVAGSVGYPLARFAFFTTLANAGIASVYGFLGDNVVADDSLLSLLLASIALPTVALILKFVFDVMFTAKNLSKQ